MYKSYKVYQLTQITQGLNLGYYRAENSVEAISEFLKELEYLHGNEPSELQTSLDLYGEYGEKIAVKEWLNIDQFNQEKKRALDLLKFSIWSDTSYETQIHRELAVHEIPYIDPSEIFDYIKEWYSLGCIPYLNNLIITGSYKSVFEYLSNNPVDQLKVGALCLETRFAFDPIPAQKWLQWYNYEVVSSLEESQENIGFMDYPHSVFVDYPFSGVDVFDQYIRHKNKVREKILRSKTNDDTVN